LTRPDHIQQMGGLRPDPLGELTALPRLSAWFLRTPKKGSGTKGETAEKIVREDKRWKEWRGTGKEDIGHYENSLGLFEGLALYRGW